MNCPKCGGECWDNRTKKLGPKSPDFKCKNKQCGEVNPKTGKFCVTSVWLPPSVRVASDPPAPVPQAPPGASFNPPIVTTTAQAPVIHVEAHPPITQDTSKFPTSATMCAKDATIELSKTEPMDRATFKATWRELAECAYAMMMELPAFYLAKKKAKQQAAALKQAEAVAKAAKALEVAPGDDIEVEREALE